MAYDYFDQGFQAGAAGINSLGQGLNQVAGLYAQNKQKQKQQANSLNMLKQLGILQQDPIEPDVNDYEKALSQHASQIGLNNLQVTGSADPEQRKKEIKAILDPLGLSPKPKMTDPVFNAKRAAEVGLNYDPNTGEMSVKPPQVKNLSSDVLSLSGLTPDIIEGSSPDERQEILKQKNPSYYNKLEMVKDGTLPVTGRSSKELLQIYSDAGLLWPGEVDSTKGYQRQAMAQNIAKGDIFKASMRGNTLVGHMDTLYTTLNKLNNMQLRLGNKAKNSAEYQTGAKEIQQAQQAALAVANEMEGYLRNSNVMSELGIQQQLEKIPVNGSPDQIQGWLETTNDLFGQRRNAINDVVKQTMGPKYKFDILTDRSKKIMEKHGLKMDEESSEENTSKNDIPSYDPQSQRLQQNKKTGKYRVIPK